MNLIYFGTLLAIKLEVALHLMLDEKDKIENWFTILQQNYNSLQMNNLIARIKNLIGEEVEIAKFLEDLLQNDIYSLNFEHIQEVPIVVKFKEE